MKIKIENLGAIHQGEISTDKPLTILTGPNNSGKSYVAYLLYGMMKDMSHNILREIDIDFTEEEKQILGAEPVDWEKAYHTLLSNREEELKRLIKHYVKENINSYFSSNSLLPTINFIDEKVNIAAAIINNETTYENITNQLFCNVVSKVQYEMLRGRLKFQKGNKVVNVPKLLKKMWLNKSIRNSVYFFPAERPAISILAEAEVERKSKQQDKIQELFLNSKGIEDSDLAKNLKQQMQSKPTYPMAINDYIYFVNGLSQTVKKQSEFGDLANEIERMLMKGTVGVSEFGSIQYTPEGMKEPLAIHMSSSLVKSLSGLVLYIRHLANEGDTLIIDEPEVNLHPDNQRIVARVIAKIVNKGFRVILSTHSDYFIKEVNNLIMLNKANQDAATKEQLLEDLKSQGYDADCFISPDDVGVYFFDKNTIQAIEVDETGFDVSSIEQELEKINHATELIYDTLFD